jgi:hypothetical protein
MTEMIEYLAGGELKRGETVLAYAVGIVVGVAVAAFFLGVLV